MSDTHIKELTASTSLPVVVQEGESCDVVCTFKDMAGAAINKASLITLTATLFDEKTKAVINSRNSQNVKDANGGSVATDGTLTLRLQPLDNVIVSTELADEKTERHILRLDWTWSDGVLTRTGRESRAIVVENLATPV